MSPLAGTPAPSARPTAWRIWSRFQRIACWNSPRGRPISCGIAFDLHIAATPEVVEIRPLALDQLVEALPYCPIQRSIRPVAQLIDRHTARRVIGQVLRDGDRLALEGVDGEDNLAEVVRALGVDEVGTLRLDDMIGTAGQGHLAVAGLVPEHHPLVGRRSCGAEPAAVL